MKFKRVAALAIATTMTACCFAGCGKEEKQKPEQVGSASVYDLLRKEVDNAKYSVSFHIASGDATMDSDLVFSQDGDKFCLDKVKVASNNGENVEIANIFSGSNEAFYLNLGVLTEAMASDSISSMEEDSLGAIASTIPLLFEGVDCLKIGLPQVEAKSSPEFANELVKNIEGAISNAGFQFVASESGKEFTLKVDSLEGVNNIAKEFLEQVKSSSEVYANYANSMSEEDANKIAKDYAIGMMEGLFEEVAKYFECEFTESNRENLKKQVGELLENENLVKPATKEETKQQIESLVDEFLAQFKEDGTTEGVKSFETTLVVKETEDGVDVTGSVKSELEEGEKIECSFEMSIDEGAASVELPKDATELKEIVGNVMEMLDGVGFFDDVKDIVKGADEATVNEFIDSFFEGVKSGLEEEGELGIAS